MKNSNIKKIIRVLIVIACLTISLFIGFIICINLIVDPIIYWLASTEGVRLFISCILSWLGVSRLFDLFYKRYWRSKRLKRFNALNIPYPRTFKGRKWVLKRLNNALLLGINYQNKLGWSKYTPLKSSLDLMQQYKNNSSDKEIIEFIGDNI